MLSQCDTNGVSGSGGEPIDDGSGNSGGGSSGSGSGSTPPSSGGGGSGGVTPPVTPTPFSATSITAGRAHTCALRSGQAFCWGSDGSGRLGDGTTFTGGISSKEDQPGGGGGNGMLTDVTAITAGGEHTCAVYSTVTLTNHAVCWGKNSKGQLGAAGLLSASIQFSKSVQDLSGANASRLQNVVRISAGGEHTCALLATGRAFCWGSAGFGRLGNGTTTGDKKVPAYVLAVSGAAGNLMGVGAMSTDIAAGKEHTCALLTGGGQVVCWGKERDGRLGNSHSATTVNRDRPVEVLK